MRDDMDSRGLSTTKVIGATEKFKWGFRRIKV